MIERVNRSGGMIEPLGDPPKSSADHLWVDYWELLCLRHIDQEFSRADLEDWIKDSANGPADSNARSQRTYDFVQHLEYRVAAFGPWYPFEVESGGVLKVVSEWTPQRRFYLFLLMAANLRYFKSQIPTLTDTFEDASSYCLRMMLPAGAPVYLMGAKNRGRYNGSLWSKINLLAEDLCENVTASEPNFPPNNTGDGGLDIVGWLPPGDSEPGRLVLFAQCGCGEEWEPKQYVSSVAQWEGRITFKAHPVNVLFTPQCFRAASGAWFNDDRIHRTVLMDRVRIVRRMRDEDIADAMAGANENVEALLTTPTPIY